MSVAVGISLGAVNCVFATAAPFPRTAASGSPVVAGAPNFKAALASVAGREASAEISANDVGDRTTPVCVAYIGGEQLLATDAKNAKVRYPMQTLTCLVPLLSEEAVTSGRYASLVSAEVVVGANGDTTVAPALDEAAPHDISELLGAFLGYVRRQCVSAAGTKAIGNVVIAIPRGAEPSLVLAAAEAAGFEGGSALRVVSADVAAALACGICGPAWAPELPPATVVVVDWGATALAVSVLRAAGGTLTEKAFLHDHTIGGYRLDKELAAAAAEGFKKKTRGLDPMSEGRPARKLLAAIEKAKFALSVSSMATVEIEALMEGVDMSEGLSRTKLEAILREKQFLARAAAVLDAAIESVAAGAADANAGVTGAVPVTHVVLAGGCCRIPAVQAFVRAYFEAKASVADSGVAADVDVHATIDSDEVCAFGAAVQASLQAPAHTMSSMSAHDRHELQLGSVDAVTMNGDLVVVIGTVPVKGEAPTVPNTEANVAVLVAAGTPLPLEATVDVAASAEPQALILATRHNASDAVCTVVGKPVQVPAGATRLVVAVAVDGTVRICGDDGKQPLVNGVFAPA